MDLSIIGTTYKLVFMGIILGTYGVTINHDVSKTAVEGENISLPCTVEELDIINNKIHIIQMEWIKRHQGIDEKIAVFHPDFPTQYFKNDSIVEGRKSSSGKLKGTVLNLFKVTVNDSGNYICEMTSYPHGSIRNVTKVTITEPRVSLKMISPYGFVKEGDEVKIRCSTRRPPLRFDLRRSKIESVLLESLTGEFILPNVTRNNSDLYVCFPVWESSGQHQQGFNSSLELTVNFLDKAECNTSSPLRVTVGEDVVISCKTEASQPLLYKWMKGNTTVSSSDTLSLSSVTSNQSGIYKLTAAFYNNQLWTDTEFSIHVLPEMSKGFTTETTSSVRSFSTLNPIFSQTTEPHRIFTSVETSSVPTTMTTSESSHFLTSTAQPNATMTAEHRLTSGNSLLNNSTPAPPAGNASTLHPYFVNPSNTSLSFNLSTTATSKTGSKLSTFVVTSKGTIIYTTDTTVTIEKVSNRATYIVIPILLLLLILIVLLYRRHLAQKKMNMPPSFKPPPPPMKYTSVRNHDVHMTDILV
ncbi:uncharacterized protein si:ch1073-15f19.2 [Triplophysa dalaica]|uniref:uncharacterized protein si:ch1073-15f19.2 n=1 Tax=Triplophysa dalaica TaxID=1582913 RepID=UPI0024E0163D|nr:uncharacterized protein si:ch1073-15f19.2 [Triplophysa dalaica]